MPKRGLNFSPLGLIRGKYTALYEREDTIRNIPVSVVKTIPIGNKNDIILNTFWIDQKRNLVIRVETSRRPSGTYSMDFIYENIDDQYLLPLSLEFTFTVDPSMFRRHRGFDMQENDSEKQNKKESKDGKVFIKFSNYEVNTGLSDEIFEKKKSENDTDD
jgi:outer membrane lipoprotein-sorting protein